MKERKSTGNILLECTFCGFSRRLGREECKIRISGGLQAVGVLIWYLESWVAISQALFETCMVGRGGYQLIMHRCALLKDDVIGLC